MLNIDLQYIRKLNLELFDEVETNELFLFRCPICGDSRTKRHKRRGYFYRSKDRDGMSFKCHNCNLATTFKNFLKIFDSHLYRSYLVDIFKGKEANEFSEFTDKPKKHIEIISNSIFTPSKLLIPLNKKYENFDKCKIAVQYLFERKIPSQKLDIFYFAPQFGQYIQTLVKGKKDFTEIYKFPAIIIPLIDNKGNEFGFQARILEQKNSDFRYLTTMIDKNQVKCFGQHLIDYNKDIWILEGVFDACFFDNSLAALDGNLHTVCNKLGLDKSKVILLYDNDKRNKDIIKSIEKAIEDGFRIAFWPVEFDNKGKDVNELVVNGIEIKEIRSRLESNIKQGLNAKLELNRWRKWS